MIRQIVRLSPSASHLSGRFPAERREERRLRYVWPVWFSRDGLRDIHQGRVVDLCSGGLSFLAGPGSLPECGFDIWIRGNYPVIQDAAFQVSPFNLGGTVLRLDSYNPFLLRVAVRFWNRLEWDRTEAGIKAAQVVAADTAESLRQAVTGAIEAADEIETDSAKTVRKVFVTSVK